MISGGSVGQTFIKKRLSATAVLLTCSVLHTDDDYAGMVCQDAHHRVHLSEAVHEYLGTQQVQDQRENSSVV